MSISGNTKILVSKEELTQAMLNFYSQRLYFIQKYTYWMPLVCYKLKPEPGYKAWEGVIARSPHSRRGEASKDNRAEYK